MAISFNGQKRIRKTFGRIPEVAPMPNLIEVQRSSYDHFLQMGVMPENRANVGLQEVFKSVFPIRDFSEGPARIRPLRAGNLEHDTDECQQRASPMLPLKVTLRLVVWDVDRTPLALDPRHQGAGRLYGRHAVDDAQRHLHHGTERVIVSQMHRSGVFFDQQGQDAFLRQIPVRRAGHPVSRLLARFRVRCERPRLCAHRSAPQIAGDDAAVGAR
jgi:DNA-directed RNA polymerase subunit beta